MKGLAFVFPGQGSQYIGMGKELWEKYPIAKKVFQEADDTLGYDLSGMCFEGDLEELTRTENTQPALLTISMAAYKAFMEEIGLAPRYAAGHSLGEYAALTSAGAIRFCDALKIVRQRGRFMQEAAAEGKGAMCAVMGAVMGASRESVEEECLKASEDENIVVVSNYNSPDQIVISGHARTVDKAAKSLEAKGARISFLKVSAPFHSPLMKPAAAKLQEELRKYEFGKFQWPVISNVSAQPYSDPGSIVENLTAQMTAPVKWDLSMQYLSSQGIDLAVELGPKKVLTNLMGKNAKNISCLSFEKPQDIPAVGKALGREITLQKNENSVNNVVTKCLAAAVCTRNRNWDEEEYRKGVIEPYRSIQRIQEQLDAGDGRPDMEQMKEALDMLKLIFHTKKVPAEEQRERFREILAETNTLEYFSDSYAS